MSPQAYKHALRLFSLLVVVVGVYQTYRFQSQQLLAYSSQNSTTSTTNSTESNATTTPLNSSTHYPSGISLFATAQAQPFVRQTLTRRGLTPIIKTYTLTGIQWVFNAALSYGHFVVAMYVYSAFKNPQNPQGKKLKIVGIGLVVLFGWIYFSTKIGYEKIKIVDGSGEVVYHSEKAEEKGRFEQFLNEGENSRLFLTEDENGEKKEVVDVISSVEGVEVTGEEYVERRDDEEFVRLADDSL